MMARPASARVRADVTCRVPAGDGFKTACHAPTVLPRARSTPRIECSLRRSRAGTRVAVFRGARRAAELRFATIAIDQFGRGPPRQPDVRPILERVASFHRGVEDAGRNEFVPSASGRRAGTMSRRNEFGDHAPVGGHRNPLACFDAADVAAQVVFELSDTGLHALNIATCGHIFNGRRYQPLPRAIFEHRSPAGPRPLIGQPQPPGKPSTPRLLYSRPMPLEPGARLGVYEIIGALGAGAMGEVYRARDTKLNRDVAIKVLPAYLATDAGASQARGGDRISRFEREAQVLASLNHPHIAQIYGVEDSGSTRAIVMELVEGEDLAERIAKGPIPVDEALPLARQIAEALEAAHEIGVIHRDLKPANIKLRPDGTIKVLDFGLAKAVNPDSSSGVDPMQSPTLTAHATGIGMILGTAAYMAPEQARGKVVDRRADVWAFGCVLYEMLAGRRTFASDDVTDTLTAVLRDPRSGAPCRRRRRRRCGRSSPAAWTKTETAPARHWRSARALRERARARRRLRPRWHLRPRRRHVADGRSSGQPLHYSPPWSSAWGHTWPISNGPRAFPRSRSSTSCSGRKAAASASRPIARRPEDRLRGALAALGAGARRMGAARARRDRGRGQAVLGAGQRLDRLLPQRAAAQDPGGWRAGRQHRDAPGGASLPLHQRQAPTFIECREAEGS